MAKQLKYGTRAQQWELRAWTANKLIKTCSLIYCYIAAADLHIYCSSPPVGTALVCIAFTLYTHAGSYLMLRFAIF